LDFLGAWLFRREIPDRDYWTSLDFPWILSSESSLFKELCGQKRRNFFLALFRGLSHAGTAPTALGMRKRRIAHRASLSWFLLFCKELSPGPLPSAASTKKPRALAGVKRRVDNTK
jgi:hypothetical protein